MLNNNSVTSVCGHGRPHHFVSEWRTMRWPGKKEKTFMFAMLLSAERFPLYLADIYTSGPVI